MRISGFLRHSFKSVLCSLWFVYKCVLIDDCSIRVVDYSVRVFQSVIYKIIETQAPFPISSIYLTNFRNLSWLTIKLIIFVCYKQIYPHAVCETMPIYTSMPTNDMKESVKSLHNHNHNTIWYSLLWLKPFHKIFQL